MVGNSRGDRYHVAFLFCALLIYSVGAGTISRPLGSGAGSCLKENQSTWKEAILAGMHCFGRDHLLICLTGLMAVIQWAVAVLLVLGLPYVTEELGRNTTAYGWFLAGYSQRLSARCSGCIALGGR